MNKVRQCLNGEMERGKIPKDTFDIALGIGESRKDHQAVSRRVGYLCSHGFGIKQGKSQ